MREPKAFLYIEITPPKDALSNPERDSALNNILAFIDKTALSKHGEDCRSGNVLKSFSFPVTLEALRTAVAILEEFDSLAVLNNSKLTMGLGFGLYEREYDRYFGPGPDSALSLVLLGVCRFSVSEDAVKAMGSPAASVMALRDCGYYLMPMDLAEKVIYSNTLPARKNSIYEIYGKLPNNLHKQYFSIAGRWRELKAVKEALADSENRLLVVYGNSGSGKSRFSVHAAAAVSASSPDGVYLVDFAFWKEGWLVPHIIADALGIEMEMEAHPLRFIDRLKMLINNERIILVLDNFDGVAKVGGSEFITELIDSCPNMKIIVTCEVELNLEKALQIKMAPLKCSGDVHDPAVEFMANVCVYNDIDLPLAEKLIGTAGYFMGRPADMETFVLNTGLADIMEAPQDVRSTSRIGEDPLRTYVFEKTLSTEERLILSRISVFNCDFGREGAETVGNCRNDIKGDIGSILDSLAAKKILYKRKPLEGNFRYRLKPGYRNISVANLIGRGELDTAKSAQKVFLFYLVKKFSDNKNSVESHSDQVRVYLDRDNIRQLLHNLVDAGDKLELLRFASYLIDYWAEGFYISEGRAYLEKIMELVKPADNEQVYIKISLFLGRAALIQSNRAYFETIMVQTIKLCENESHLKDMAAAIMLLGWSDYWNRDFAKAKEHFSSAKDVYQKLGDRGGVAEGFFSLGYVCLEEGDHIQSVSMYEKTYSIYRVMGDNYSKLLLSAISNITNIYTHSFKDFARSLPLIAEQRVLYEKMKYPLGLALTMRAEANIFMEKEEYDNAVKAYENSIKLYKEAGSKAGVGSCYRALSIINFRRDNLSTALEQNFWAVRILYEINDVPYLLGVIFIRAKIKQAASFGKEAALLLGLYISILNTNKDRFVFNQDPEYDSLAAAIKEKITDAEFAAAWSAGLNIKYEELMSFMLRENER